MGTAMGIVGMIALQQVQEKVGPELVEAAGLVLGLELAGDVGETVHDRRHPVAGQVRTDQVAGPFGLTVGVDPTVVDRCFVTLRRLLRTQPPNRAGRGSPQLTGGRLPRRREDTSHHHPGHRLIEMISPFDDHPHPGQVDVAGTESNANSRETLDHPPSQIQVAFSRRPGPRQRGPDLIHAELVDRIPPLRSSIGVTRRRIRQLDHIGKQFALHPRQHPGPGLQQQHQLMAVQTSPVNPLQQTTQLGPMSHRLDAFRQPPRPISC